MATTKNLPALVRSRFKAAQESGDLTFYPTRVFILNCDGFPFQLRFAAGLVDKEKATKAANSKPVDPFDIPPDGLFISDVAPAHFLVLNKFPVIPDHFILATKAFKEQTDLLENDDLAAAYECLKEYKKNGEELFGFFNSGKHSGASQPHRHIQFIPVESMHGGLEKDARWSVLADSLVKEPHPVLPFTCLSSSIPENPSPEQLHKVYTSLHERACAITQQFLTKTGGTIPPTTRKDESPISYNLGLTDRAIALCPRLSEGLKIKNGNGDDIGPISLNGTTLGGTLLVKGEAEWDALRNDESKLKSVLHSIGVPPSSVEH